MSRSADPPSPRPGTQVEGSATATSGYPIEELSRTTGLPVRTIRHYIKEGLIPRPAHRGPATVYTKSHAVRLKAIKLLRKRDRLPLATIKARLTALGDEGVEALLSPPRPAPAAPVVPMSLGLGEGWEHIELMPGLELLVSTPPSPVVRRLATEIVAQYRNPIVAKEP